MSKDNIHTHTQNYLTFLKAQMGKVINKTTHINRATKCPSPPLFEKKKKNIKILPPPVLLEKWVFHLKWLTWNGFTWNGFIYIKSYFFACYLYWNFNGLFYIFYLIPLFIRKILGVYRAKHFIIKITNCKLIFIKELVNISEHFSYFLGWKKCI